MSNKPYVLTERGPEVLGEFATFAEALAAAKRLRVMPLRPTGLRLRLRNADRGTTWEDGLTSEERERWREVA